MKRSLFLLLGATFYLTLSGFQCASTQLTTAKVALQSKDYKKAESSLKEEVAVRPENGEAWYLLGVEVYAPQRRYADMGEAVTRALNATQPPLTDAQLKNLYIYMLQPWLDAFNAASTANNEKRYTQALAHIDTAILIRPEFAQNYSQKGAILISSGATDKAMEAYRDYVRVAGTDIQKGINKGLAIGMNLKEVKAKIGEPTGKSVANAAGEYALIYPDNLYVYMGLSKSSEDVVKGWTFFGPEKLPADFKAFSRPLSGYPYYRLGVEAYGQGSKNAAKYEEALEMLRVVEQFDPTQPDVESLIAQIYIDAGREAEARAMLDKRMKEDPKNPKVYINYSLLLYNAKDYNGATGMLQKVLDLGLEPGNSSYQTALFNLGVYYKNWGKELQDSIKVASSGRPTAAQEELYAAKLRESLKYFERLRSVQSNKNDYALLAELGNLYYVLAQDDKLLQLVKDFEAIRNTEDMESDGQYWRELSKLYTAAGDSTKAIEALEKAKALGR